MVWIDRDVTLKSLTARNRQEVQSNQFYSRVWCVVAIGCSLYPLAKIFRAWKQSSYRFDMGVIAPVCKERLFLLTSLSSVVAICVSKFLVRKTAEYSECERLLNIWCREGEPSEKREKAKKLILNCLENFNPELSLAGCNLKSLPACISFLEHITALNLVRNQLTAIPPKIWNFPNLEVLSIAHNRLTVLPPEIGNLFNLRSLYLNNNQLTGIPPEIGKLPRLLTLSLKNNQLTKIPSEVGNLPYLLKLNLRGNRLSALPAEISNLSRACKVNICSSGFTSKNTLAWIQKTIQARRQNSTTQGPQIIVSA